MRALGFALILLGAAGCESTAEPEIRDAAGRELGPDDFVPDATTDVETGVDADDVSDDALDAVDPAVGLGRPCQLLLGDCEPGLKCVPSFNGTGVCRFVAGNPLAQGEPCGRRGFDDCAEDHLCVSPDEETGLRCFRICNAETREGCLGDTTCAARLPLLVEPVGICF